MALGPTYRGRIYNSTGQILAIGAVTIKPRRYKYGTDGSTTDEVSGVADIMAQTATVANLTYAAGTTQDNTTLKYTGGFFEITITSPASSAGDVIVYIERSVDGGTTWPDGGGNEWVLTRSFSGAQTKRDVIEL